MSSKPIHLVCSAGGVKCFSYIGAIKCLEEYGYEIKSVSASSMGSLIGILLCAGMDATAMGKKIPPLKLMRYVKKRHWLKWAGALKFPFAMYHSPDFKKILTDILGMDPTLGDLKIPYATMALDLRQQQLLTYSSVTHPHIYCSEMLKIATAIPPMYAPYSMDTRLLVDASVATESPAWVSTYFSGNDPIIILKTSKPTDEKYVRSLGAFITNMVVSAASGNDKFSLNQITNAFNVEINCGDQAAEDFAISQTKIEKLILQGYDAMKQTLNSLDNNLYNRLSIENISSGYNAANDEDQAAFNSDHFAKNFVQQTASKRELVFISYSHKDKVWFDKIQTFLRPLEEFSKIKVWDDEDILPGQKWRDAIQEALASAKVALCIVTPNFFNSAFITKEELNYFLEVSEKEGVTIFLVAASAYPYEESPLGAIQFANNIALPLDQQDEATQNATITTICRKLVEAIKKN